MIPNSFSFRLLATAYIWPAAVDAFAHFVALLAMKMSDLTMVNTVPSRLNVVKSFVPITVSCALPKMMDVALSFAYDYAQHVPMWPNCFVHVNAPEIWLFHDFD